MARNKDKTATSKGRGYPRQGMGPVRRWLPSWRVVLGTFFALFAIGMGGLIGMYVTTDIPKVDDIALAQTTKVYYADGKTELGSFAQLNRSSVPLNKISPDLQHAVIASEDSSFYENAGVDLRGIARAFWNNIQGKPTQGGSTLTQQYVERYYTGTTTSLPGKVKEAILAIKIDNEQSKDTILENYLNTIYFGRGAYGIEAAAKAYFGVHASELTLSQSATLAGIIPAPSAWDPAVSPDRAKQRFERVISRMVSEGWIKQADADAASFPKVLEPSRDNAFAGTNGYLLDSVRKELVANGFTEEQLATAGYHIVSTIDVSKQQAAVDAVAKLPKDRPENYYVGLISMDPRNGEIYAMYGGKDYLERQRNSVMQDRAQGGSTFKAFAVVEAMDQGMSPLERFDSPAKYRVGTGSDNLVFTNVDGRSYYDVTVNEMTARSLNTGFIQLNEKIGPAKTYDMAVRLGLPEDTPGLDRGVGNTLGSASPKAVDMARAFGTLANNGQKVTPHIVREVKDHDGNRVFTGNTASERVISEETAQVSTYVLKNTLKRGGTAEDAALPGREAAGKTGTSSGPKSAWFAAYIPQMVTVVDMYGIAENGTEAVLEPFGGVYQVAGGNFPAQVWHDYMVVATDGMDIEKFPNVDKLVAKRAVKRAPAPVRVEPTPEPTITEEPTEDPSTDILPPPDPLPLPTDATSVPPGEDPLNPGRGGQTPGSGQNPDVRDKSGK
ncbi:transglycosylase domain-containing protein [Trueperella pecoris]|uniref:transglycosylase domain-containing protein n=1 Tax=Trueperella pecoris TaxID=2733571 RepID=UPI00186B82BE|nr:transglycosylase domain-containing protein [Trueperella pecoris]QOQ39723.1 penicillin-binding protein [Trueperella pecoris]